jgi:hypothetical protein
MGGKPSKGTKYDRRLVENRQKPKHTDKPVTRAGKRKPQTCPRPSGRLDS